jgi:hypothetical protein
MGSERWGGWESRIDDDDVLYEVVDVAVRSGDDGDKSSTSRWDGGSGSCALGGG